MCFSNSSPNNNAQTIAGLVGRLPGRVGAGARAAVLRGASAGQSLSRGLMGQTTLGEGVKAAVLGRTTYTPTGGMET